MHAADFCVSNSNAEAWKCLQACNAWPTRGFVVYGPPGCGKTHLGRVFEQRHQACWLTPQHFEAHPPLTLLARHTHFVLDDVDQWLHGTPGACLLLLQLYNLFQEEPHKGGLLLLAQTPPNRWGCPLPDLISRLNTCTVLPIHPPDDALICKVMAKLFQDFQLDVPEAVLVYLLNHMERSFAQAQLLVTRLHEMSLVEKKSVSVELCRRLFKHPETLRVSPRAPHA